jgi:intracellular septation protein A
MKNLLFAIRPLALDLISTLVFVAVGAITHNPLLATVAAVAAGVARVIYLRVRRQRINAMQWMSLGLVMVFGAATLLTQDARFMMAKPTIVYVLVGAAMLERGWMLPYMPPRGRGRVPDSVMIGWGYVWAGLMFLTAALNAVFALTASFAVWSSFIAIFPVVSKLALFAVQFLTIRQRAIRHHRAELAAEATAAQADAANAEAMAA